MSFNSGWAKIRFPEVEIKTLTKRLKELESRECRRFLKWLYSGIPNHIGTVISVASTFGVSDSLIHFRSGKRGLIDSVSRYRLTEPDARIFTTKNVRPVTKGVVIPVHKFVLIARSQLFEEYFLVLNGSMEIRNRTEISYESMKILVDYLYSDTIGFMDDTDFSFEEQSKIVRELISLESVFELNVTSSFQERCIDAISEPFSNESQPTKPTTLEWDENDWISD